ncbi:FadR family transcriptional regulator [Frigoribacterium sp. ACAM 257]|uniref:FadR/GntR family transcriptional regulator n=1 Tax=Frigoribacterium sp. ACAM 257 TaxID=2508998 RepID=UPI0011B9E1BA|nr:FCD domain-containing protein [Frigoribacterium sp. ACAM 257]TWX36221.1 FadR family transcriptional regulator [Frigoribacterium sp. ACAM 257]
MTHRRSLDEILGTAIVGGELQTGTVLKIQALSVEHGVSRSVIRETLRILETLGMVVARQRVGITVLGREHWRLLDPRVIAWRSHADDAQTQLHELMQLRGILEPAAAELAARQGTHEQLAAVVRAAREMTTTYRDRRVAPFAQADLDFHSAIVAAASSSVLAQLADTVLAALLLRYSGSVPVFDEEGERAVALHVRIADALASRDAAVAADLTRTLVDHTRGRVEETAAAPAIARASASAGAGAGAGAAPDDPDPVAAALRVR